MYESTPPPGTPSNRLIVNCATGWCRIVMTSWVDYYGVAFLYLNGVAHFQAFGGQKIQVCRDLKIKRFTSH